MSGGHRNSQKCFGQNIVTYFFYYRGVLCRESIKLEATAANIRHAVRRRLAVLEAIERHVFNYADFFPDSKHAIRFGHLSERKLIKNFLDEHLIEKEGGIADSSYVRYTRNCKTHLYPYFGSIAIQDLTGATIREWIKTLTCRRKTIVNILTPLRAIVRRALSDNYIKTNPFDQVEIDDILKKEQKKSRFKIDPFDRDEMNAILTVADGQIKNLYQFAFFTGLRPSELMGLRWSDVDWIHHTVYIEETIVDKKAKGPKTDSGYRTVMLLPPARRALEDQKPYTFLACKQIFYNPRTGKAWETSQQLRRTAWMYLLKRAGVRYRNPYQTRHTYASMLISQGENVLWVSKQMGHANMQVTLKRYTDWLPDTKAKGGYQTRHDWDAYLDHRPKAVNATKNKVDTELSDGTNTIRYLKR